MTPVSSYALKESHRCFALNGSTGVLAALMSTFPVPLENPDTVPEDERTDQLKLEEKATRGVPKYVRAARDKVAVVAAAASSARGVRAVKVPIPHERGVQRTDPGLAHECPQCGHPSAMPGRFRNSTKRKRQRRSSGTKNHCCSFGANPTRRKTARGNPRVLGENPPSPLWGSASARTRTVLAMTTDAATCPAKQRGPRASL